MQAFAHGGSGLRLVAANIANDPDDGRGVEATAQAAADPNIADQVAARRLHQELAQPVYALGVGCFAVRLGHEVPIALNLEAVSTQVQGKAMSGRKRLHVPKSCPLAVVAIAVHQKAQDVLIIGHPPQAEEGQQRFDLGSEEKMFPDDGLTEALHTASTPAPYQPP